MLSIFYSIMHLSLFHAINLLEKLSHLWLEKLDHLPYKIFYIQDLVDIISCDIFLSLQKTSS